MKRVVLRYHIVPLLNSASVEITLLVQMVSSKIHFPLPQLYDRVMTFLCIKKEHGLPLIPIDKVLLKISFQELLHVRIVSYHRIQKHPST